VRHAMRRDYCRRDLNSMILGTTRPCSLQPPHGGQLVYALCTELMQAASAVVSTSRLFSDHATDGTTPVIRRCMSEYSPPCTRLHLLKIVFSIFLHDYHAGWLTWNSPRLPTQAAFPGQSSSLRASRVESKRRHKC